MWKKRLLLGGLLGICAWFAWQWILRPPSAVSVTAVSPVKQNLSTTLDLNAVVINDQIVTITALLDGQIAAVLFGEGDVVEQNEVLALLDNQQAQSLVNKARAELAYKQQRYSIAERSHTRVNNLYSAGNTSQQNLDDSLDALQGAEAEVDIARADLELAEIHLDNSTIKAPFEGVVVNQYVEGGQWVEAGTPLFKLVSNTGYLIEAQVDASDWSRVEIGQGVSLTTESEMGLQWHSEVSWIAPMVDLNERRAKAVAVRFEFGDGAPRLLLGQEIDAQLEIERVDDVLTLPLSSMNEEQPGEYSVFVVVDGRAERRSLEVGLLNATHAEIISGIKLGDEIVVSKGLPLSTGSIIQVIQP